MSAGMKVKCPLCKTISFETTDKYDPNVTPNGAMVRKLVSWEIDWLCTSTTKAAEMTCPRCGTGQLAPSGRLTVIEPTIMETEEAMVEQFAEMDKAEILPKVGKPVYICEVCGKECSTALALNGHLRSHKGGK
jgi:uncharacterized protein (DUF983 family)